MTLGELAEEKFKELESLVIEYLDKAQEAGEEREEIRRKAYQILEESETVRDVREGFLEMIALVDGITA